MLEIETIRPGRLLLDVRDISYNIGNKPLFNGMNFSVQEGEAVALIGASGTGKSTLLKMIVGMERPNQGEIIVPGKVKIGYVAQDLVSSEHAIGAANIKEMFLRAKGLDTLEKKIRDLEGQMTESHNNELMERYGRVMDEYEKKGGYVAESKIAEVLAGMGLEGIELEDPVDEMSSGQKVRLMIAQALFVEPDLLILDNPVSQLDAQARDWLSAYIKRTSQGCLITTTDMEFINGFANKIVEISPFGRVIAFRGNYRDFVLKRDQLLKTERMEYEKVQAKLEQLRITLKKQKVWGDINTAASVNVRRTARRIDRLEREQEKMPMSEAATEERRVKRFRFEEEYRSGEEVVIVRGVRKQYGGFTALNLTSLDLLIKRGEVFAVLGGNGSGKSTLLRMIARVNEGDFTPERGTVFLGASVKMGYYTTEWNTLQDSRTILEEAKSAMDLINEGRARAILNHWGFNVRITEKMKVGSLSKGERVQLSLAKLMLNRDNLLVLDEPSTNLTQGMKKRLVESLQGYTGTIILATHDSELLDALEVRRSLILPQGKVILGRKN